MSKLAWTALLGASIVLIATSPPATASPPQERSSSRIAASADASRDDAAVSALAAKPVYYAFALNHQGCGPQARFVKLVGAKFYTVAALGCDGYSDRGTIKGGQVRLVGRTESCGSPGNVVYDPRTLAVSGGPKNLRIEGETRKVGPTTSLRKLDSWWSRANVASDWPTDADSNHVSSWLRTAARTNWTFYRC